jgi:hypothetical protein
MVMENSNDKKENTRQGPEPITDGDSRPDKFVDPDFQQTKTDHKTKNKQTEPVTTNRQADDDKRDDFRDAK